MIGRSARYAQLATICRLYLVVAVQRSMSFSADPACTRRGTQSVSRQLRYGNNPPRYWLIVCHGVLRWADTSYQNSNIMFLGKDDNDASKGECAKLLRCRATHSIYRFERKMPKKSGVSSEILLRWGHEIAFPITYRTQERQQKNFGDRTVRGEGSAQFPEPYDTVFPVVSSAG